jgi:uncharacterized protein
MKTLIFLLCSLWGIATSVAQDSSTTNQLGQRILTQARSQIGITTGYDPSYTALGYPGGDVPMRTGVCSDVVIRALRPLGLDLQKAVHEDMRNHFRTYPQRWGLKGPDKNIDHRRVPNLMHYLEQNHVRLDNSPNHPSSFHAGDIVAWDLGGGVLHIGIVSEPKSGPIPWVVHNIGMGTVEENILFQYRIIGHYQIRL